MDELKSIRKYGIFRTLAAIALACQSEGQMVMENAPGDQGTDEYGRTKEEGEHLLLMAQVLNRLAAGPLAVREPGEMTVNEAIRILLSMPGDHQLVHMSDEGTSAPVMEIISGFHYRYREGEPVYGSTDFLFARSLPDVPEQWRESAVPAVQIL